jgi:thymidylate synthase
MRELAEDLECESAPRGKPIKELIASSFTLTDPRNRLITSPARKMNYGFSVGEFCWYLRGDTDLETMVYYNKRMAQFSDDGKTINSAYGDRMFNPTPGYAYGVINGKFGPYSPFEFVMAELKRDPDSRRAVMHINRSHDLINAVSNGSKDVPCTMSLQLLVRNRKLHMHVLMRSSDINWGLPHDVFSFTCLQEVFLYELQAAGVPVDDLGEYHHTAGSLHLYEPFYGLAKEIAAEPLETPAPMSPFTLAQVQGLAEVIEPAIRNGDRGNLLNVGTSEGTETLSWMTDRLLDHRVKREAEEVERNRKDAALNELSRLSEEILAEKETEK